MIARMEKNIEGLRQFLNPFAPSVSLVGARLKADDRRVNNEPIYIFGKGRSLGQALECLYGEAAEREALYLHHMDEFRTRFDVDLEPVDTVPASSVLHANAAGDLGSTGCAAHTDFEIAARFAITELIERYAFSLWWTGQCQPVCLDVSWSEHPGLEECVKRFRKDAKFTRKTSFFYLPCAGPIRVVMARSEIEKNREIAVAFAASETLSQAAQRAALELMSVELETADFRIGTLRGEFIATDSNRALVAKRQLAFATTHAHLFDGKQMDVPKNFPGRVSLSSLGNALEEVGLGILLADLSRPEINLPTCRAMFKDPNLQPLFPTDGELSPL